MKKLLNSLPLLIALLLLTYSCTRSQTGDRSSLLPSLFSNNPSSEVWQIKEDSIYDGDTLRVVKDSEELKIRLCGIDAPEKEQELGVASRDYLRSLVNKGNGQIYVTPIEKDRYGRTVAELFVPVKGKDDEIFLNGEMVRAGMAMMYPQYVGDCPNKNAIALAEEMAKESKAGVEEEE
jgi:endonuclease YncB( thermonuclease family)